jgi:FkbM family methyltransferase
MRKLLRPIFFEFDGYINEKIDALMNRIKGAILLSQPSLTQNIDIKKDEELIVTNDYMLIIKKTKDAVTDTLRDMGRYGEDLNTLSPPPPRVFFDIGANIGAISLKLASQGWKGYAFEASRKNAEMLERSVKINNFDIKVINKAVHKKTGMLYFHANGPWGHVVTEDNQYFSGGGKEEIESISLDDWIKTENIDKIDFIKIDIEGSEPAALRGMKNMLVKYNYPPIFCEINSFTLGLYKETQKTLYDIISNMGYKPYYRQDNNSLVEFDFDQPPFVVVRDLIFINNFVNIKSKLIPMVKENEKKIISRTCSQLKYYKMWKQNMYGQLPEIKTADYVCLALRDYPQYMKNNRIRKLLTRIKKMDNKYPFLEQCLEWYV